MSTTIAQREFTDPDALAGALPGRLARLNLLGRGPFRAELCLAQLGRVTLQCSRESVARVAYNALPPDKIAFVAWPRGGELPIVRGRQMQSGELLAVGGGTESYHRTRGSLDYVALIVDADELARVSLAFTGRELRFDDAHASLPLGPRGARLLARIEDARRIARCAPGSLDGAEAAHALEQSLLHALVECLSETDPRSLPVSDARRARIMARFEVVVESHGARPLHLAELCARVGVPERTLRTCCQLHLGMSPHRYLLLRRLELARRALVRGDPDRESVTSIATRHGFWELGRFAVLYRSLFGEPPSATLRHGQAEFA